MLRKAIRTAALRQPLLHALSTSRARYQLLQRLGRPHEKDFKAFRLLKPMPGRLYLDVGANLGMSIHSILAVDPEARVVSFEPNPIHAEALQRIVRHNPSVSYSAVGLADSASTRTLYCPVYNGVAVTGLASFDRDAAWDWLNAYWIYGFEPGKLELQSSDFLVETLDGQGLNPDVIKVDVQGYEWHVLRGGIDTLRRCHPALLLEAGAAQDAVNGLLRELGYAEYAYQRGRLFREHGTVNQFYIHPNKIDAWTPSAFA